MRDLLQEHGTDPADAKRVGQWFKRFSRAEVENKILAEGGTYQLRSGAVKTGAQPAAAADPPAGPAAEDAPRRSSRIAAQVPTHRGPGAVLAVVARLCFVVLGIWTRHEDNTLMRLGK